MMGQEPTRFTMPAGLPELMDELEQAWPAMQAALYASGVPLMNDGGDGDGGDGGSGDGGDGGDGDGQQTPPWGDDFDPERAWKLVTNLRGDVEKLKERATSAEAKVKEHDDATKTEQQKLEERATSAESQAAAAARSLARLEVAIEKGLTPAQAKRLVGDTKEELEADADELLKSFGTADDDGAGAGGRRTPTPRMRTGAAPGSEPEETDPQKLAEQVPRR